MRTFVLSLLLFLSAVSARAEVLSFGEFDLHHVMFNTDFLQPDVAAAYQVRRAGNRALLNISLRHRLPSGGDEPWKAHVKGTRSDLIHKKALEFREIEEQGAVYYIADFEFLNEETLYFDIQIRPDGQTAGTTLTFQKKLYVSEP